MTLAFGARCCLGCCAPLATTRNVEPMTSHCLKLAMSSFTLRPALVHELHGPVLQAVLR